MNGTRSIENNCTLNYQGSAGGMEVVGSKSIFSRSIDKDNLRYDQFLRDRDSKSFPAIKNTYTGIKVQKLECVGHVQKRVGTRLSQFEEEYQEYWWERKPTNMIDRLQNYYGIAIRSNKGDLQSMKKAVYASYLHVASLTKNNWHDHCPDGQKSWCMYKKRQDHWRV